MPDPTPTIEPTNPKYGIDDVLIINSKEYTLQSYNPTDANETYEWKNQHGQTVGSRRIDTASTISFAAFGEPLAAPLPGQSHRFPLANNAIITSRGMSWQITNIAEAGAQEGIMIWTISARRWSKWPTAGLTATPDSTPGAALPIAVAAVTPPTPPA